MNLQITKPIFSIFAALAMTACATNEVTVRDPVNMADYPAQNYIVANMVVTDHVRMAAPEGWHFHSKKKEDAKDILFWIKDKGNNSTRGVVRMSTLDFEFDLQRLAPKYAEISMNNFVDKEVHETELDGYPTQIVTGKHNNGSVDRISALVSTKSKTIVEITFASTSNSLLANPSVPYSILNSYKLMPGNLSMRYIRDSISFRCDDGSWIWLNDRADSFVDNGYAVAGVVDESLVIIDVARVSTSQFRDLFKMKVFDVPEYETEVHLAGQTFAARAIGRGPDEKNRTSAQFLFKHMGKDYSLGVSWVPKRDLPANPKTLHEIPAIRTALDNYFTFAG